MSPHADILLVEDNRDDVELALHAFRCRGLAERIHVVYDGVEALDFLFCRGNYHNRHAADLPRCVLLDLKLPRLDGHEVLRQIRGDPRTRRVPVVVLTSSQQDSDLALSYDLGVNSYLVKPLDFADFREVAGEIARYWLDRNQVARPAVSG